MNKFIFAIILPCLLLTACNSKGDLSNEIIKVEFSDAGLESVTQIESGFRLNIEEDNFLIIIDDDTISSESLTNRKITVKDGIRTEACLVGDYQIEVVYELQPGWEFLSKQVFINHAKKESFRVQIVNPWLLKLENSIDEQQDVTGGRYGKILRYSDQKTGSFFLIQNPYTQYSFEDGMIDGEYTAEMLWDLSTGAFVTDRACLGLYNLTGNTSRHDILHEWSYTADPETFVNEGIRMDYAEIRAITDCASAFVMIDPKKSTKVHIGWCENDYQIDVAKPEGRKEYLRIIDQAAAVGCENVLFTPNNSVYGPLENNRDAWGWENLLWLGLGQKVRAGEWVPGKDTLPAYIQEMLDYAKDKGVKLMAYVYPSLPFMQNPEWTAWRTSIGLKPEHYLTVDTGLKSYQDWFVDMCIAFYEQTGISGYSFDHWWIAYEDEAGLVSSKYQQWYGARRILEELRRRAPEIVIDGRQQYHNFGTFTWLAGTYPHPTMSDEQPGSFNPFPDLSTDRISADRQRYVAHRLMVRDFTPIEILPGFITHQTQRSDANRVMRRDTYRQRDWDYLGWKYSIISTIATAPFNLVINYLPARDTAELNNFSPESQAFFNKWLSFTDQHIDILKNIRPILGQPMVGRCDGTAAIDDDHGYVFLFNPNYRQLPAEFTLDQSIGLQSGQEFIIREIYPDNQKNLAHPEKGFFDYGDIVKISMTGTSSLVLEVVPLANNFGSTVLFNTSGEIVTDGSILKIEQAKGIIGTKQDILVYHPKAESINQVKVNGIEVKHKTIGNIIRCELNFQGEEFRMAQQIDQYAGENTEQEYRLEFTIPQRIKDQLSARKELWPIVYSEDDLKAPWVDPSRLLLFMNIADPYREKQEEWKEGDQTRSRTVRIPMKPEEIKLEIDGKEIPVLDAYNGVYSYVTRTFLGFYVDVSTLTADVPHNIRLVLPKDLKPGQFQGLFFDHVEDEYTDEIRQKAEGRRQK